jgi:hypothetical protein
MSTATSLQSPFAIARVNAHTWVVAFGGVVIPGAVLATAQAASDYASDLAQAAGFTAILPCELRPVNADRKHSRLTASHRRFPSHGSRTMTPAIVRKGAAPRRGVAFSLK